VAIKPIGVIVAVVGIGAGVALAVLAPRPPAKVKLDATTIASELDGKLREVAAGVHSRATTLAELPRLAAAVSTDATTVRDMAKEELAFRAKPGETITIGQHAKGTDKSTVLLMLPSDAMEPKLDRLGVHLDVVKGKLVVTEAIAVVPKDRADEVTGVVAVSWTVDQAPITQKLDAVDAVAKLDVAGTPLQLARRTDAAPDFAKSTPALSGDFAKEATLTVWSPLEPAAGAPLQPVGFAVAGLAAIAGLLLMRGKKPVPAVAPAPSKNTSSPAALASTAVALQGSAEGTQVGRYTIVRRLGSGGMAEVFLARVTGEAGFEKLVALKVLHKVFAAEANVVEHFLDEARLASRLTHPNIVQIADLGKAGDEYFIAMEYIEGADLELLLDRCREQGRPVELRVALHILRKICDGLHAAHTASGADGKPLDLVHRDVKSANMFVARNGVVKIGDFGIAKANVARVNKTEIGTVKGTAEYMAPEHRIGQPIDKRADLYAVGAIAYEILSGQPINLDLAVLADKGKAGWPHLPKLTTVRPELPAALDDIVFRALAYEKEARYSSCLELEEAFEAVANQAGAVGSDKLVAQWVETVLGAPDAQSKAG
jgi:serine/threonine-protein kinase